MTILTTDILPHICEHVTRFSDLNKLMRASKPLHTQLAHHAHDHWLRIGKATCGGAHWNEALFTYILGGVDGRYTAMLHMCPWLSAPERLPLDTLKAYGSMNVTVELKELKVAYCFLTPPLVSPIQLVSGLRGLHPLHGALRPRRAPAHPRA